MQHEIAAITTKHVLRHQGFTAHNSIALVAQCRDEIAKPFVEAIDHNWMGSFNISSLAGTVFCGKTGFNAALHHAPQEEDGTERYVVFCGPHIAIDANGMVGNVVRRGRKGVSSACGALIAFQSELASGKVDLTDKPLDVEFCNLKRNLIGNIDFGRAAPSLAEVTQVCHQATLGDVREIFTGLGKKDAHHAIVSGILIHGPDYTHYFWPGHVEVTTESGTEELRASVLNASRKEIHPETLRYLASKSESANLLCSNCSEPMATNAVRERANEMEREMTTPLMLQVPDSLKPGTVHHLSNHGPSEMLKALNEAAEERDGSNPMAA